MQTFDLSDREEASLRRAALVVHAMPEADRAWLVGQLDDDQRRRLQPQLDELERMGIPRDRTLVGEALHGGDDGSPGDAVPEHRLGLASAAVVHAVVRDEPDALIAHLLRLRAWPWSPPVLDRLGAHRAASIRASMALPRTTRADQLEQAIVQAVWARVERRTARDTGRAPTRARQWISRCWHFGMRRNNAGSVAP